MQAERWHAPNDKNLPPQDASNSALPDWKAADAALALLCALAHDWGHDGRPTPRSPRLEDLSAQRLINALHALQASLLDTLWRLKVIWGDNWLDLLLAVFDATDPREYPHYVQQWRRGQQMRDAKTADLLPLLLIEADLAAGLLPSYGDGQNKRVLLELARGGSPTPPAPDAYCDLNLGQAERARRDFLSRLHLASPVAWHLGWPQLLHHTHKLLS